MIREKLLSITDITEELNSGTATIKFILKRFSSWLPFERIEGHHKYSRKIIPILIKIMESLETGVLPSEIDQELKTSGQVNPDITIDTIPDSHFIKTPSEDIRVSKDGLSLIKSLFDDIAIQQNRVATAHEKRTEAEERKAVAIEKRAEAEEKKAMAMNNIANALQEMNQHRIHDSQTREMALQAAVQAVDETPDIAPEDNDTGQQDDPEAFNSPDLPFDLLEATEIDMDDLTDLIQEDMLIDDPLVDVQNIPEESIPKKIEEPLLEKELKTDDLYALIDQDPALSTEPSTTDSRPTGQGEIEETLGIDDLSKLLDPIPHPDEIDDLSALIDTVSTQGSPATVPKLDDLSLLIDDISSRETPELDNLSLLIEPPIGPEPISEELDDLSLLITPDSPASDLTSMDDLSALIDDKKENLEASGNGEDTISESSQVLGSLISKTPALKPDITPKENLKEYKAAIMKIILGLKTEGLSAEESTNRLNMDGVQTISGKSKWSEKAISQIYNFIDSAR